MDGVTETVERIDLGDHQVAVAVAFGAVLTLVGVLGPLLAGQEGELFGLFGRNYLHDLVHLLSGLAGLGAGYYAGGRYGDEYNRWLGVVYLLVFVVGTVAVLAGIDAVVGLLNLNMADNVLHLLLGVVLAGVGFGLGR